MGLLKNIERFTYYHFTKEGIARRRTARAAKVWHTLANDWQREGMPEAGETRQTVKKMIAKGQHHSRFRA